MKIGNPIEDDGMIACDPPSYIKNNITEYKRINKDYVSFLSSKQRSNHQL